MSTKRSASVGALPHEKRHFVSRNESSGGGISLDVRCACQFYQSTSLLPERANPVPSRPISPTEQIGRDNLMMPATGGFLAGSRLLQAEPDAERLSVRSFDRTKSLDQPGPATVDVSFIQNRPDLEAIGKTRGLVVRRISDANIPTMGRGQRRSRFTSVDRMSSGSGGGADLETLSMRSGISLRRISHSPSKSDLFVADLNIPAQSTGELGFRSLSGSRRPSVADASNMMIPHVNLIAATPLPLTVMNKPPDFSRNSNRVRSPSLTSSRRPMSPDYMRPSETEIAIENLRQHTSDINSTNDHILPQNRPIDVSKYDTEVHKTMDAGLQVSAPISYNGTKVQKAISPAQIEIPVVSLRLEEKTNIKIEETLPQEPLNKMLKEEGPKMINVVIGNQGENTLKRSHSPERRNSEVSTRKSAKEDHLNNDDRSDDRSDLTKPSYASRFMSMFTSKNAVSDKDQKTSSDASNKKEKSPAKMSKVLSGGQETSQVEEIVSGSTALITNRPIKQAESVQVTETFSLKVDEMDQYMSKPRAPRASSASAAVSRGTPSVIGSFSSREDLLRMERSTSDIKQSFNPIIIPRNSDSPSFLASEKTLYSSESEMSKKFRLSDMRSPSKEPSIHSHPEAGGKPLFSAAIAIDGNQSSPHLLLSTKRSPSEQKISLANKFVNRTQSQDRHRMSDAQDYLSEGRMTKTVSFNFGERQSRLSAFEKSHLAQGETKQEYIDRSYLTRDHEYEPIGAPVEEPPQQADEANVDKKKETVTQEAALPEVDRMEHIETVQKEMETLFSGPAEPIAQVVPEVATTSSVYRETTVAVEPIEKPDKKGFMASAQDRTRRMHAGFRNQAGKLRTKLRPSGKKSPSGSPKTRDRKRFKAPEFSKLKMPDIKRPDIPKLRDIKRPEFTKFSSKFKLPEKITTMKLKRSKSMKENGEAEQERDREEEENYPNVANEISPKSGNLGPQKKLFDFNFATYPRALSRNKKKKKSIEPQSSFETEATEATSGITSTGTQPSLESSSSPQGDRGPGPVRSRWADKFSDVSYNDSEGSRYRRFESEQGSFDRESSMERRIREEIEDTASEDPTLTVLSGVTDNKQFAEYDEENRAIHEISNLRSGEFKRRPVVHQDSDVRSDDSKDIVGWSEKDIEKNTLLLKSELESDEAFTRRQPEDTITQETQSTTSSGKKLVLEEIDEDEFFLRKRGISQDNIELRQYITDALRGGYDKSSDNAEEIRSYGDYAGETPPPKPRRLYKIDLETQDSYFDGNNENVAPPSEENLDRADFSMPKIPLRKLRGRSKYSIESGGDEQSYQLPYFDNDEDYLRPPSISISQKQSNDAQVNLNRATEEDNSMKPQPPKRHKRRREISLEKDSFLNGFSGRSVSNSFLQPPEDVIIYRTEHEYHHVPLATPDKYSDSLSIRKSLSNYDYEDRISRGAVSLEPTLNTGINTDKYLVELNDNDGYAVVRKDPIPKPTPPARRKKFARLSSERRATMPTMPTMPTMTARSNSPPERPPPPKTYTPSTNQVPLTVPNAMDNLNLDAQFNENESDIMAPLRAESPRHLQSGEVINKMKHRPLPAPPRPPREKRQNIDSSDMEQTTDTTEQQFDTSSQEPKENDSLARYTEETEAWTQTDPLPDDFVCEDFEITDDMKVIVPTIYTAKKTLDQMLLEELQVNRIEDSEQLTKGIQRFREANQRSLSERSRTSSQAEQKSKSLSRPQTPSALVVEHEMLTSVPKGETLIQASLVVQPIVDQDDAGQQEQGLLSSSSQSNLSITKDDLLAAQSEISNAPSSNELNEALELLTSDPDAQQTDEEVERTLQRYREELDEIGRRLMETTISPALSSTYTQEDIKESSDREEIRSDEDSCLQTIQEYPSGSEAEPLRSDDEVQPESKVSTITLMEAEQIHKKYAGSEETKPPTNPQPPPRRKSLASEQLTGETTVPDSLPSHDLTPTKSLIRKDDDNTRIDLPYRVSDLEVDRLRVHALQAGQIMISQLPGSQISSDELDSKSGNLIIKNIELPPGLIENIVERVRQTERSQLHTMETQTQTSLESSPEKKLKASPLRDITIPPPKPPRLKDMEMKELQTGVQAQNTDEETQTDSILSPSLSTPLPTVFPSAEYLQSLAPLAFYNLHRATTDSGIAEMSPPRDFNTLQKRYRRHQPKPFVSDDDIIDQVEPTEQRHDIIEEKTPTRQSKSQSEPTAHVRVSDDNESVSQAGRKFITACSLSLVNITNQLCDYVKGSSNASPTEASIPPTDIRNKQVPVLAVLFIVITFAILIFLATGRNIHTHHWDYFNPPGHDGRPSS